MLRKFFLLCCTLLLFHNPAAAWYPRSLGESQLIGDSPAPLIGSNRRYLVDRGDTLIRLARGMGLGYRNLVNANPHIDPWLPSKGQSLLLPYSALLNEGHEPGITINLAELRLYLVWMENDVWRVRIYPVGVGAEGFTTPEGRFQVLDKAKGPTWQVPASVRAEKPDLPRSVPPGPENPLGDFWLRFTQEGHGIHGTNEPYGIGRQVSHGCIRLYPEDIADLFNRVKIGTTVRVIYRPAKVGIAEGRLMLEIHPDYLNRYTRLQTISDIENQVNKLNWAAPIDRGALRKALDDRRGVPVPLSQGLDAARRRSRQLAATDKHH